MNRSTIKIVNVILIIVLIIVITFLIAMRVYLINSFLERNATDTANFLIGKLASDLTITLFVLGVSLLLLNTYSYIKKFIVEYIVLFSLGISTVIASSLFAEKEELYIMINYLCLIVLFLTLLSIFFSTKSKIEKTTIKG